MRVSFLEFCESQVERRLFVTNVIDIRYDIGIGGDKPTKKVKFQTILKETEKL